MSWPSAPKRKLLGLVEPEDAVVHVLLLRTDEEGDRAASDYSRPRGNFIVNARQRLGLQKIITRVH